MYALIRDDIWWGKETIHTERTVRELLQWASRHNYIRLSFGGDMGMGMGIQANYEFIEKNKGYKFVEI